MNLLDEILTILEIAASTARSLNDPAIAGAGAIADSLLRIAQKAVAAHEAQTGQPIDLGLLHPIEPVP